MCIGVETSAHAVLSVEASAHAVLSVESASAVVYNFVLILVEKYRGPRIVSKRRESRQASAVFF